MGGHHLLHEPLAIRLEEQGDTAVVRISGACDACCHDELRERLLEAETQEPDHIVVDLTRLRFIDSIGLRLLIGAWNRARQAGKSFAVALPETGEVRRVLELTGVERVLPVAEQSAV